MDLAAKSIPFGGHLVMGTFALDGPEKCSGLPVSRYDADLLTKTLGSRFNLIHQRGYVDPSTGHSPRLQGNQPLSSAGTDLAIWWPESVRTPPAFADRHVFARSDKELICVSLAAEQ